MTTTSENAINECGAIFKALADASWPQAEQRYVGNEKNDPPGNKDWFRWNMQHTDGEQASLSNDNGKRRWRRNGLILVQCFGLLDKGGLTRARRMAESVRDAYQGIATPGGVWFRNATTQEVAQDGRHYQVNAIIQFNYDEVR
jgi:hypothetical protein